jgi:hypothetical protein
MWSWFSRSKGTKAAAHIVLGSFVMLYAGCARPVHAPRGVTARLAPSRPTWGPAAEGLQCRLRPAKRVWSADERPTFKIDLRNRGARIFAFVRSSPLPLHAVSVDGRWYRRPDLRATEGTVWPLAPGVEFTDLAISLPNDMHVPLASGHHLVQVAFLFEGVEVVSNLVAIEILTPPEPRSQSE